MRDDRPDDGVVLVHGAATTGAVWGRVIAALAARDVNDVVVVERPCSGSMDREVRVLAPAVRGRVVVGQSGGATLALALAASDVPIRGALCHEPAAGSLAPRLLDPVAAAYREGGVAGFGAALYGPSWTLEFAPDPDAVARDLPMFRAFEPAAAAAGQGRVRTTVGEFSPAVRHDAAAALSTRFGFDHVVLPDTAHFAAWDAPDRFADAICDFLRELRS